MPICTLRSTTSFSHWQSAKLYKKTNTNVDTNWSSVFSYLPRMPFVLSISRQFNPSRQHPVITAQKCWYPTTLWHSISPRLFLIQADFKGHRLKIYRTNILATSNKSTILKLLKEQLIKGIWQFDKLIDW